MQLGPGSHAKIIFSSRYGASPCGGCNEVAALMDQLGPDGCEREFDKLVADSIGNSKWPAMITQPIITSVFRESIDLSRKDAVKAAKDFESRVQETLTEIQGPFVEHAKGWEVEPFVQEAHKRLFHAALNTFSIPEKKFSGRGIVTIAGGTKYFACGYMLIYQLRELGCKLPIQVWYLGKREMDAVQAKLLTDMENVELVDATEAAKEARIMGGWQAKIWAILESPFEEVLYLDADNNPVKDPSYLFDCEAYKEFGAILWTDQMRDITADGFRLCGLPIPGNTRIPEHPTPSDYLPVESGQILVDKRRVWKALQAVKNLNDHSDFWFGEPYGKRHWYFYGDKSTYYLGFNASKVGYGSPKECQWVGSNLGGVLRHFDDRDEPIFEHRVQPRSKVSFVRLPDLSGVTNRELFMEAYHALHSKWSGCTWVYQNQRGDSKSLSKLQLGKWKAEGALPLAPEVELCNNGRVRNGNGFRWMIEVKDDKSTLILSKAKLFYFLDKTEEGWECKEGRLVR